MDKDGSGEVDFIEFVLAVWNYCSFNHLSLVRFAFDLYDLDGSGEIEHDEVVRCVREVWGSAWEDSNSAQKIVAKLDTIMETTASGKLSVQKFQEFALRHPMLLFPAFQLQTEMQKKVLGEKFWLRAAKKRGSVNPRDLNWASVRTINKVSKKASSKFLNALEDDLGEQIANQLRAKPGGMAMDRNKQTRSQSFARSVRGFLTGNNNRHPGDEAAHSPQTDAAAGVRRTTVVAIGAGYLGTGSRTPASQPASSAAKQTGSPKHARKVSNSSPQYSNDGSINPTQLVVEDLDSPSAGRRLSSMQRGGNRQSVQR